MSGDIEVFVRLGQSYGRALAVFAAAGDAFNRSLTASYESTRRALEAKRIDPERASVRRYELAVRQERAAGLRYVRAEAARVRRELGLPS